MKHPNIHYTSDTEPDNPELGDAYYDTSDEISYVWDGRQWQEILCADLSEVDNTRYYFEQARRQQFKEHPELAKAWKEYKLLEKLTLK